MSNFIKVPFSELSSIEFFIKSVTCEGSDYDHSQYPVGEDPETGEVYEEINYARSAWGRVEYAADYDGQELTLSFDWQADASNKDSYKDSFDFEVGYATELSTEKNFVVVDDDGDDDNLNCEQIEDLAEGFEDFRARVKSEGFLPVIEEDDVLEESPLNVKFVVQAKEKGIVIDEFTEEDKAIACVNQYEKEDKNNGNFTDGFYEVICCDQDNHILAGYVVERDNAQDLRFKGFLVANVSSRDPYNDGGRWFIESLYRSLGGKYICCREDVTRWLGERDRHKALVCTTIEEVKAFFGQDLTAKELYARAGIDNTETVD